MVKTWTYKELEEKYGKLCKRYKQVCYDKQRLKAQLDREIKINRIMKSALKQIASENDCYLTIADKVLKEIDNKE